MSDLLTIREGAAYLKVSPITIRRYIASRRLPALRIGRSIRLRREDVENLARPLESKHEVRPFTRSDPLWALFGIGNSGLTDVSENKHKYLAEAYLAEMNDSSDP